MASEHQVALLQEYGSCDKQVSRIDTLIWQTASVVFPITLAGFAYFGLSSSHTKEQFFVVIAVAIGSITLLTTWHFLSRQWYAYQAIAFYRMREIESELGMWHYRYSFFMRRPKKERNSFINTLDKKEKTKFQSLENQIGNFPRVGLRAAIAMMTSIFILGWIGLLIREYILTF
jgi:hypothetical protein